jgi:hypothetical protein
VKVNAAADELLNVLRFPNRVRDDLESSKEAQVYLSIRLQMVQAVISPNARQKPITVTPRSERDVAWLTETLLSDVSFVIVDPSTGKRKIHLPAALPSKDFRELVMGAVGHLSPEELALLPEIAKQKANELIASKFSASPTPARGIEQTANTQGWKMIEDQYASQLTQYTARLGRRLVQQVFIAGGVRYFPLSLSAALAQAPETTIRDWIKKRNKFDGKVIKTHISPTKGLYVSEESVHRMAHRFMKWPSQKPAGRVILGETSDQSGYIGLTDAARTIGVERHTIWRWTTKGTAPTDKLLDVIKCPASDQFYIGEKDVSELKNLVPRTGLRRGRRSPHDIVTFSI